MAREHPFELQQLDQYRFSTAAKRNDWYHELYEEVRRDDRSRGEWLDRAQTYYERRYCRLFRGTNWPWPGASDVVMPTIDMTIDRLKAAIVQLLLPREPVSIETTIASLQQEAKRDQRYMNWLLLKRIPDFRKQIIFGVDSMLSWGHGVFKVYWDYRTRSSQRSLDPRRLPVEYERMKLEFLQVVTTIAEEQNPTLRDIATKEDATRVTRLVFNAVAHKLAADYRIDAEDQDSAIQSIVAGLEGRADVIKYRHDEVEANYPRIVNVYNPDFIPQAGAGQLQDADRVTNRLWLSVDTLRQRARDHNWDSAATEALLKSVEKGNKKRKAGGVYRSGRDPFDWARDTREGVQSRDTHALVEIYEVYVHKGFGKDGRPEKAVTIIAPEANGKDIQVLKPVRPLPYHHGKWPFVHMQFELNDERFHSSRSVGEKIDDIDIEVTKIHRAKLNNLDLLAPSFQYRLGSEIAPENTTFAPGRMFPVMTLGDIAPLPVADRTIQYEREENSLLTWNERYIGSIENVAAQQNISEARTATEVRALQNANRVTLSLRGLTVQISMFDLFGQVWDLDNQFGDEEEYLRVTGAPRRRKTIEELRRDFFITPVGTIESSDPVLEEQKAFLRFQTLYQIWAQTGGTGVIQTPDGMVYIDIAEALRLWLDRANPLDATNVLKPLPEQIQQQIQSMQAERQARRDAAEANQEMSIDDFREFLRDTKKQAPHKGAQRVLIPGAA